MAKIKLTESEKVTELITNLNSDFSETVQFIRELILATDSQISEQVKWNSASFYFNGEMKPFDPKAYKRDIVVCNIHSGKMLLVFPTGAKVKDKLYGKDYPDGRKIINIENLADLKAKAIDLQVLIKDWLAMMDR